LGPYLQQLTRADVSRGVLPDARVILIDNGGNWGFARGNNVGLELALRDPALNFFWLLNNDTEVPADTIGHLAEACGRRPDVGLWGGTVIYHGQPESVQALGGGALNRRTAETRHIGAFFSSQAVQSTPGLVEQVESEMDYALGACMWATRAWVEHAGLLGEHYFLYYEEIDWALRGRRWFKLGYEPKAVVLHKEGASIGTSPSGGSPLSVFHLVRSRLIFARLHLPAWQLPSVLLKAAVQSLKYVVKRRLPLASATLRGVWAGLSAK
jgi:GT2 family glycosyltransferase